MQERPQEYRVVIPTEIFTVCKLERDGKFVGTSIVNSALIGFEPKIVFGWQLSLNIDCENCNATGLPSPDEIEVVQSLQDQLDASIKANGNALYLAHLTSDSKRNVIWRVYDPERAHQALQEVIRTEQHSRPFDYEIHKDPQWKLSQWLLDSCQPASG